MMLWIICFFFSLSMKKKIFFAVFLSSLRSSFILPHAETQLGLFWHDNMIFLNFYATSECSKFSWIFKNLPELYIIVKWILIVLGHLQNHWTELKILLKNLTSVLGLNNLQYALSLIRSPRNFSSKKCKLKPKNHMTKIISKWMSKASHEIQ